MAIYVSDLMIEVTRRCNMCCDHCLRGDAQNLDISDEVLEAIARDIQPSSVVFTGGEPSLNIAAIKKYFALAEKYGTLPCSFYVVTNGKENQEELAVALLRAYGKMSEPEMCGLALSIDCFHETVPAAAEIFKGLAFFSDTDKAHPVDEQNSNWLLNTGRAAENGIGVRSPYEMCKSVEDLVLQDFIVSGERQIEISDLYISSNGNVVSDCDQCYEDIDDCAVCKVQELKTLLETTMEALDCAA